MADELLPYYEKELAFIRQMGAEFSREHPKIASRLGINAETIEDPHTSRLVESFAYLNARIQHKLDDEFPELSNALLTVLYPHYQRPIPSMCIVQFSPEKDQLDGSYTIEKGALLETAQFNGETCRFTTAFDTELLPIELDEATLIGRPFNTPGSANIRGAAGVLKMAFSTFNDDTHFHILNPHKIRLYLKGQSQHTHPLYQLLLGECLDIVIAESDTDLNPISIGPDAIKAVGFSEDENILVYPKNSFIGYRLLTEFFSFADKFMFIDIELKDRIPENITQQLNLYFYLKSSDIELEHNISAETFALACSPVVNLFSHQADPIKLEHTQHEYQIIPDMRRPRGYEVYSVDKVTATNAEGEKNTFLPFYGIQHGPQNEDEHAYWFGSRRPAKMGSFHRDEGTDVYLTLVDLDFNPNVPENRILTIQTQCTNRDLPIKLPFSATEPQLQCVDSAPPCERIQCITQPSSAVRPPLGNNARWRLISHLNLNFLSIGGHENATDAFKEILRLYDFRESSVTRSVIESIASVNARAISAPINVDGHATICRGLEIEVVLDENQLTGTSSYLFATVLEHFFALYCPINSFTRTLVKAKGKEGYLKKCPPRSGEKIFL